MTSAVIDREVAPADAAEPELQLLGGFSLHIGGSPVEVPESSQRVLVYLALHERPQSRQLVAGSLWPESCDNRAVANLRSSLWRIPSPHGVAVVDCRGHSLAIDRHVAIDVRNAEAVGWSLVHDPNTTVHPEDGRLFLDDLLPGWYDDWVIMERERLAQLRLHFLEAIAHALLRQNRVVEALDVALRLVAADPFRERSQRALISVFRAEGSLGQAMRQLDRYRAVMMETFGCEPSADLVEFATGRRPIADLAGA